MTKAGVPKPDTVTITRIPRAPFVRLPDPPAHFAARAARLRHLAEAGGPAPYLHFVASLAEVQACLSDELPSPQRLERAGRRAMPPLDRRRLAGDPALDLALRRFIAGAATLAMPAAARVALERLQAADDVARAAVIANVLADGFPADAIAEHLLAAAALQVHFAAMAARLDAASLQPAGIGACPICGTPPSTSLIVGWPGAEGARYCFCPLCATLWNHVGAKCALCGSAAAISFRQIAADGDVKAEICGVCDGYVKILDQQRTPALDPVADDIATLGLDILLGGLGLRRGGVNPFLVGY